MLVFHVTAAPLAAGAPPAAAFVVAETADEAVMLLRKDFNFTGYRLPPFELTPYPASHDEVRRVLGDAAAHEKGVYAFAILGETAEPAAATPPKAAS